MKLNDRVLVDEISAGLLVLEDIHGYFTTFLENELPSMGRTKTASLVVSQVVENFYTALETMFLRISQAFENNLKPNRWHSDLLDKMTIEIQSERIPVIRKETWRDLKELMRFRHFKRYYYELDYDWTKLDFIITIYHRVYPKVYEDLVSFRYYVLRLMDDE